MTTPSLYNTDFYAWTQQQAARLRQGQMGDIDAENIAEEIEDLGRATKHELRNRLAVLLAHFLKWHHQPQERPRRERSWRLTIKEQREQLNELLQDNPSLKASVDEALPRAYRLAILKAAKQTRLDEKDFPTACPWTLEQLLDEDLLPD